MKGKGGSANAAKAKKIVRDQIKKKFIEEMRGIKNQIIDEHTIDENSDKKTEPRTPLDRFKPKKKKTKT